MFVRSWRLFGARSARGAGARCCLLGARRGARGAVARRGAVSLAPGARARRGARRAASGRPDAVARSALCARRARGGAASGAPLCTWGPLAFLRGRASSVGLLPRAIRARIGLSNAERCGRCEGGGRRRSRPRRRLRPPTGAATGAGTARTPTYRRSRPGGRGIWPLVPTAFPRRRRRGALAMTNLGIYAKATTPAGTRRPRP